MKGLILSLFGIPQVSFCIYHVFLAPLDCSTPTQTHETSYKKNKWKNDMKCHKWLKWHNQIKTKPTSCVCNVHVTFSSTTSWKDMEIAFKKEWQSLQSKSICKQSSLRFLIMCLSKSIKPPPTKKLRFWMGRERGERWLFNLLLGKSLSVRVWPSFCHAFDEYFLPGSGVESGLVFSKT